MTDRLFKVLLSRVQGIRMIGSCALNMCYVASGRADMYYEGETPQVGPKPWDFTAPEVIVKEAGGIVILPENKPFDCTKGRVFVTNSNELKNEFLSLQLFPNL